MQSRILVIDDEESILEVLGELLQSCGYDVMLMQKPDDVFHLTAYPDLIILDLMLSGVDGRDICLRLKSEDATKNIPVVLLSAQTAAEVKEAASTCGADTYLTKPFDIDNLLDVLESFLPCSI